MNKLLLDSLIVKNAHLNYAKLVGGVMRYKFLLVNLFLLCATSFYSSLAQEKYYKYIDPFIGSQGDGHIFVGPSCPFGMVKPGPDINKGSNSGYDPDPSKTIYGFSQIHVSGTGGGPKYGNILVMPFSGDFGSIKQESLRENEITKAGYYGVELKKWNIKAELTTSPKVAFHRYTFTQKGKKGIKIDAGEFLNEGATFDTREAQHLVGSEIEVISDSEVRGYSRVRGGWNNGKAHTIYFHAVFDHPFTSFTTWKSNNLTPGKKSQFDSGEKTGALLFFDNIDSDTIQVKIGISFTGTLKAKENLDSEVPHWSFQKLLQETQDKWEDLIHRIEIDASSTKDQKIMFYTALYHTMLMPVNRTGENPLWNSNLPYYDDFYAIWDTFRSSHPLITLISPSRQTEIINALLNIFTYDGYLPDARSGNCNGRTQGGSHAEVMITDAYVKGLKGINYSTAFKAMLKDATIPPGDNEEKEGRGGLTDYNRLGYVSNEFVRAGNRTVEYAHDDYCIAIVAKGLKRSEEYRRFMKQSDNWQNLWRDYKDHGATGFIMPRSSSGGWIDSIQCDGANGRISYLKYTPLSQDWPICLCWWCGFFYEASSWEYSFYVPHDVASLIKKCGGKEAFQFRLNTFFENQYYNVSNEPSFLTPCLYHWIGRPDLSSERIRKIILKNYNTSPSGIPGNDDSGAMSSWFVFHMMGFYPNAGQSYYLINSPLLKQTTLHQENGKDFKVIAKNLSDKNVYIKSVTLNGKSFEQSWIEHQDIENGGELVMEMDSKPSPTWGKQTLPPSKHWEGNDGP